MDNSNLTSKVLLEIVASTNRTTRAVRAFVTFLFIQLSATTVAAFLLFAANSSVNIVRCVEYGENCEPNVALNVAGVAVWVVGVILSSITGWWELKRSDPNYHATRAMSDEEFIKHENEMKKSSALAQEMVIKAQSEAATAREYAAKEKAENSERKKEPKSVSGIQRIKQLMAGRRIATGLVFALIAGGAASVAYNTFQFPLVVAICNAGNSGEARVNAAGNILVRLGTEEQKCVTSWLLGGDEVTSPVNQPWWAGNLRTKILQSYLLQIEKVG